MSIVDYCVQEDDKVVGCVPEACVLCTEDRADCNACNKAVSVQAYCLTNNTTLGCF